MAIFSLDRRSFIIAAGTSAAAAFFTSTARAGPARPFTFESPDSPYLSGLRSDYSLDDVIEGAVDDQERVRRLTHWSHQQFSHGQTMPSSMDARTILSEAKSKGNFRCTEFAEVLAAACTSVGIAARPVSLLTEDAAESGSAHVAVEAYDRRRKSWFHADSQFDLLAKQRGRPINIAQLKRALAVGRASVTSGSGRTLAEYRDFVTPYLFYLDVPLDGAFSPERKKASKRRELLYAPPGAPLIDHIQGWKMPADYTRSLEAFYAAPIFT